ncbi:MAG: glycosyltransferase family 2 protein [Parabacteroides sp.]|nr:glycosyltransferase family 2 protein [Parabacteroides sp.]
MNNVAIIIPTLNEEKFIARCLDSVIAQSYPFEEMDVMVVDGGSKDRTHEIVNEYHEKYHNIRLLENPGRIQSIAFNIGVKNSTAPYIVRLDAHAFYKPYYIEGCIKGLMSDSNRGNVGGQWDIQPQNESLWATTNAILNYCKFGIGGASYRVGAKAGNVDTVPFGSFPRAVIEKIGGMREDLPRGEDNEFNSRIHKAGYDIYFDPAIECVYYARPTLKASCKQMYANGESIGHLFYVDKGSIGLRHLIPLLFVLGIISGVFFSFVWSPFFYVLMLGLGLYFLCDFVASLFAAKEHGLKYFFPLFVMFFCVHISYGWGTIVGLFSGRNLKMQNRLV